VVLAVVAVVVLEQLSAEGLMLRINKVPVVVLVFNQVLAAVAAVIVMLVVLEQVAIMLLFSGLVVLEEMVL
jgi:hypothetical protein